MIDSTKDIHHDDLISSILPPSQYLISKIVVDLLLNVVLWVMLNIIVLVAYPYKTIRQDMIGMMIVRWKKRWKTSLVVFSWYSPCYCGPCTADPDG